MYRIGKSLTIDNILELISEEDIFKHYLGNDFKIGTFHSPLRDEGCPSFCIFVSRGTKRRLMFKDHATGHKGTCFDLVMLKYGLTLVECLNVINNDFSLGLDGNMNSAVRAITADFEYCSSETHSLSTELEPIFRPFQKADYIFWNKYGVSISTLEKYNVKPVKLFWIIRGESKRYIICNLKDRLCYAYCFPKEKFKIYQPRNPINKWISNTTADIIQGYAQLPSKGKLLIITKSLKDVMCFDEFGLASIAPMSESVILKKEIIDDFKKRYKLIYSLMDFDRTGVVNANALRHLYGIEPFFLTSGRFGTKNYKAKDFSDYIKNFGVLKTVDLLKSLGIKFKT